MSGLDPCHGVIRFDQNQGFLLMDLGSDQGIWVNNLRLSPSQPHLLRDGDMVKLGSLQLAFFQECLQVPSEDLDMLLEEEPFRY